MRQYAVLAAIVLVTALAAPAVGAGVSGTVTTIDADHDLTDRDTIDEYDETEVASTTLAAPDLRLTVAEDHDDVGLEGFRFDTTKRYLRFQYNESFERTIRVFIPSEYWHPVVSLEHDAENVNAKADFRPTDGGRYTAVTVTFEEQTDAVFAVSAASSGWFWAKDTGRDVITNSTGYEPPRIGSGGQWQYVPRSQLGEETSYPINSTGDTTLQYDNTPDGQDRTWLSVPECSGDSVPVCQFEKQGTDGVFVLSKTENPPQVRWKAGTDPRAGASSAWNDLAAIPDRVQETIDGLFGG